ncbi:MAG TPA: GNAT family N-acetyltransferase [Burkholderiales bacterium]|nr:GNAT family N-acetyltransferase [Burkholderiales bacterium]
MASMTDPLPFTIKPVYWQASQAILREIRTAVFIIEQGVPQELEWDEFDEHAYHVVALAADGTPIGTGRLLQDGQIGRLAVLKEWRGRGVGKALLDMLLVIANKMGNEEVKLHAQVRVLGFYLRSGFVAQGREYVEVGIPHVTMTRTTTDQTSWPAAFVFRPVARIS